LLQSKRPDGADVGIILLFRVQGVLENRDCAPVGLAEIGWIFFAKGDTLRWEIAPRWVCSDAVILRFRTQDSIETLVPNSSDQIASPRLVNP
jgi:hypothetical protein